MPVDDRPARPRDDDYHRGCGADGAVPRRGEDAPSRRPHLRRLGGGRRADPHPGLSAGTLRLLPPPLGRPAQGRVPDHPGPDRSGQRRLVRGGAGGQPAEVVLRAQCPYRLHLRHPRRGARTHRHPGRAGCLRLLLLPRHPHRAGGGTGGHIFPAIALAKALTKRPEGEQGEAAEAAEVRIVGRQGGPEESTVRAQGIAFEGIDVLGFRRSVSPRNLLAAARGAAATLRALRILRRAGADVAVGTGGYVSIPVATAAAMLRIPLVLHEANAIPGVANRLAGRWAVAVAVSFPGMQRWFRAPVTLVGNPTRPELAGLDRLHRSANRSEAHAHFGLEAGRRTLLVFGGSQGARRINEAALGAYERWRGDGHLQVLHLVGAKALPA